MKVPQFVISIPHYSTALEYMSKRLLESVLVKHLGFSFPGQGAMKMVTASNPPDGVDYEADWTKASCNDWLLNEISDFVNRNENAFVLFEDAIAKSTDSYLLMRKHPLLWKYHDRVFWPATGDTLKKGELNQVIAWAAGPPLIALFTSHLMDASTPPSDSAISETELDGFGSRATRLVVDVFDGGGFLIWDRDSSKGLDAQSI